MREGADPVGRTRQRSVRATANDARMDAEAKARPADPPAVGMAEAPANRRLTLALLAAWLGVTFGVGYFARELQFQVLGWPFSFWMGAQGGVIAYVAITWFYARRMARLERGPG